MSAIHYAINQCRFQIPPEILNLVFVKRNNHFQIPIVSIEECIKNEVYFPRVLPDCGVDGGVMANIPLDNVPKRQIDMNRWVFTIPKRLTQGRRIIQALSLSLFPFTNVAGGTHPQGSQCGGSALMAAGQKMMDAMMPVAVNANAYVQLVGENTVLVQDTSVLPIGVSLRCKLEPDEALSHLTVSNYSDFAVMLVYALKSYIYNTRVVSLDIGALYGGQNIGVVKDIIDGYSEAEELYQTHRKEIMGAIHFITDNQSMTRHIKMMVGGGL